MTARATATLRLSTGSRMGTRTVSSVARSSSSDNPPASGPTTTARGAVQSTSVWALGAPAPAPTVPTPRAAHQLRASSSAAPVQSGTRKAEPIEPRSALGEKRSVEPLVEMTALAPVARGTGALHEGILSARYRPVFHRQNTLVEAMRLRRQTLVAAHLPPLAAKHQGVTSPEG